MYQQSPSNLHLAELKYQMSLSANRFQKDFFLEEYPKSCCGA